MVNEFRNPADEASSEDFAPYGVSQAGEPMSGDFDGDAAGGLSRRQLLTRGAIAGGLVWAAPVIRTTAAYATTANGTERPCTNFFMVSIDKSGRVRPEPRDLNSHDVPPAIRQWFTDNPGVTVQFPSISPFLTQTSDTAWAVLLPEVTGPNAAGRQCRMILGWSEKGHKYAEAYVDPNPTARHRRRPSTHLPVSRIRHETRR